ncbi:MAG TPA: hypothetical protein DHW82_04655 [Spirochaetia bacterium]|nr:MAG: hypothetical protein A2Y41_08495 [Spirochaetes bacterium GWB1_36_13]HCL56284.1 hypothetical protein [Spirochaetia bacterium]
MKKTLLVFVLVAISSLFWVSCSKGKTVKSVTAGETVTDADWSADDLQKVSKYMIDSISDAKFIGSAKYRQEKPRWMLSQELANDSDEHINTRVIMEKIRTKLINNAVGIFIDDQALNEALKQQSMQQSDLFDNSKAAQVGKIVGAKLILRGRISNIRKKDAQTDINFYNITLQIVDLETTQILWTDEYEMGRAAEKGTFR